MSTEAAVIQSDDLNIIDDAGNPSDGFGFLDITFSQGKTLSAALSAARAKYPDARVATASEFNDLLSASGITFDGALTAADAFSTGGFAQISSGTNYNTVLRDALGATGTINGDPATLVFTDPDASALQTSTRDYIGLGELQSLIFNSSVAPPQSQWGWLLVSESGTVANEPPIADAGSDQSIRAGDIVDLDGSASYDDDTLPESLVYAWSFVSKPAGSLAVFDDPTSVMPSFLADLNGTYSVQLLVADEDGAFSDPAIVTISSENLAPIAVADSMFTLGIVGEPFLLDGTGSSDPESDPITYDWVLVSAPVGSLSTLMDASTSTPSFTPDVEGAYLVLLEVRDAIGPSDPVLLEITATNNEEFAEIVIVDTADQVDFLTEADVTTQGNQQAFGNFLSGATKHIQKGNDAQAIDKLLKAIERVDGCALRGAPDGNGPGMDWVTDCDEQMAIYDSLIAALIALTP